MTTANLLIHALALWSIAAVAGIIIGAPHNGSFGMRGTIMVHILMLGLIAAASLCLPDESAGNWGILIFVGGLPSFMAGLMYARYGLPKK